MEQVALDQKRKLETENPEMKAVHEVIAEGQDTIRQINEANIAIEGEIISQKLDRLEKWSPRFLNLLKKTPMGLPEIRKFMGYYLPTTLKLVSVYRDLDAEPIQGANIQATKRNRRYPGYHQSRLWKPARQFLWGYRHGCLYWYLGTQHHAGPGRPTNREFKNNRIS